MTIAMLQEQIDELKDRIKILEARGMPRNLPSPYDASKSGPPKRKV